MKRLKPALFLLQFLALFALGVATGVQAEEPTPSAIVNYDKANDRLTVVVDEVPLKSVMAMVGLKSGLEVLFDDKADEPLTIDIQSTALEVAVKNILKGRNYALSYDKNAQGELLLIGVMVLPVGENGRGGIRRIVPMDEEAYRRTKSQLSHEQLQQIDTATERWQARLGQMPDDRRQALERRATERLLREEEDKQQRAEMKERHKQMVAQKNQLRQKRTEAMLKGLSPERRATFDQRGAAAREQVRQQLLNDQLSEQ